MIKRIQDLTKEDKERWFAGIKEALSTNHGVPWAEVETKIQKDIDDAFDDEAFSKMDPEFAIDAAYLRRDFDKKPNIVDYLLWSGKLVTNSDYVDVP